MDVATRTDQVRAERWFHALSDQTRLRVIELLGRGDQCVCDLTAALEMGQSRLSFHLKTLKDAGLVCDRRQGRWTYYSLNAETVEEVGRYVDSLGVRARGLRTVGRGCE